MADGFLVTACLIDNWLSDISRFWSCLPRLSKLVDSKIETQVHGFIRTLHHCQMWSSYTLHIFTWFARAQVDDKWGHGPRREQMLALTRLAPCTKISCRGDWWIPWSNFTGCWGCDHGWWTCATGWFLNLFNFAVLPAVNSPSDSVGKVMLMGQCLCSNIPFRGAFRAQKNGSRGSAVPQGVHVHAAQFGKNHWIQLNTIEYHIIHNIEWHIESNWIQLNLIESNWIIWCNCNSCNAHDAALRCDALADFCLGLFLSLECHGCTKSSERGVYCDLPCFH